ncbi:DNA polymerase III subunit delta [uncultured Anaerovibrio sp.]|uniref:DNA polymerase III subunit delta n=1 Tax=uncultured Anaerovibrio sp. TaxID=361586 RepID=UPI0025F2DE50|nr:DNA polymerase III subunit delta [uncultured Anaerovibrio sp.]
MNYGEFRTKLKKGQTSQLYLLAGEEGYYIERAEKAILATVFPAGVRDEDVQLVDGNISINELISLIETVPFFSEKNVIIIRDADFFKAQKKSADGDEPQPAPQKSSAENRLYSLFANMPEFNIVIFELKSKPDKRKKLFKEFARFGQVMEAEPVKSYNIDDWLHGKLQEIHKNMDNEAHAYFARVVGIMDKIPLGFLDKEMDKLAMFMGPEQKLITREIMAKMFSDIPEIDSFAMNDAIGQHDIKRALYLFKKQQDKGVYIVGILGPLIYYVRQLWQARTMLQKGLRDKALGQFIGVNNPYILKKITKECQSFSDATLKKAFLQLAEADLGAKTGRLDSAEVEAIIIGLCRGDA